MKTKLIYLILMGGLLFTFLYVVFINFLQIFPETPIKVTEPIEILNEGKVIYVGDIIDTNLKFCKYTDQPGTSRAKLVSKRVVNGIEIINEFMIPQIISGNAPPGCGVSRAGTWVVPSYVVPRTYILELSITYQVNPFREVVVKALSEPFEVIRATPSAR